MTAGPRSRELFEKALGLLPGGVSSPVRAFRAVGGTPIFFTRGEGARLHDADGRSYLDFCGSWGPLILGHAHPRVVAAVSEAAGRGLTFGAPHEAELRLAEKILAWNLHLERVRFVSSGTEAVMSAVRVARGFTGRSLVVKFDGCYHGHADHLLVKAGSGLATFGTPSSAGVPEDFTRHTAVLDLDDAAGFDDLVEKRGREIAAVLIEPIPANHGLLLQRREFLHHLRRRTKEIGACLIFDEVISGFRVARGGASELYDVAPDLATYGKIVGGGLPVGAYGGRREILDHVAPLGRVYQAGTLSGNPLGMAAGLETLAVLEEERVHERLEVLGAKLEAAVNLVLEHRDARASFARVGSIFWLCLQEGRLPRRARDVSAEGAKRFAPIYHRLLEQGIYLGPSAYEVGFLSTAHTEDDLSRFAQALDSALKAESRT
jgi:glutamate-1-semialdehyde 2,1-aminomutase